ncbi:SANT/Myb domain [Plasmopara halstedii]|uniref:SANT/Myb domain n=1 Tax=Plasmopara halstedii TaxID=4781 RepID=A0A0P1AVL7_PLAHL|nr:SANT/Myb domain [Plasmopara halstedii]CEG45484.1 SANT/Myb domain [Plasmopara halstedii]|eukprot:XP_024581853.1 SANT/Myb domain [Plasmopara halstedii]
MAENAESGGDEVACKTRDSDTDADTIARRTRTKYSLVDVQIDTLEASLCDVELELMSTETEEDREYQRFLSSLVPTEQENLSFLDEEDEEYKPDEEEDDQEDEVTRRGISKKELTDLLLDSTHMTFLKTPTPIAAAVPALEPIQDTLLIENNNYKVTPPSSSSIGGVNLKKVSTGAEQQAKKNFTRHLPVSTPAELRGRPGAVTEAQCIQLASQMHKHLQLLLQSYHLLAKKASSPELATCRAMIEELQQRGEKALKYKNALLLKLQPTMTKSNESNGTTASEGYGASENSTSNHPSELNRCDENSSTENLLALRRVTRSLTAAHAAVAHPSMFELVGSQKVDEFSAVFEQGCSLEDRDRVIQVQMLQLDTHLQTAKKRRKGKKGYSSTEDLLLAHGVKRFGTQASSWEQIQRHFLPTKTVQNLRHRYKYLIRPNNPMNAVKALQSKLQPQHHSNNWLLEEDLRIARGLIEFHQEKYRFACLAKKHLPHRSRFEVRKRWERLEAKFRSDLVKVGLEAPNKGSFDLAVAIKEYLEDKLRHRMFRQSKEAEKAKVNAALQLQQLGQELQEKCLPQAVGNCPPSGLNCAPGMSSIISAAHKNDTNNSCRTKNLHPALFFSSWSFISPATLLNFTCKHNWPAFMNEDTESTETSQTYALDDNLRLSINNTIGEVNNSDPCASEQIQDVTPSDRGEGSMNNNERLEFTDDDEVGSYEDEDVNGEMTSEQKPLLFDSEESSLLSDYSLWTSSYSPLSLDDGTKSPPKHRYPLRLKNSNQHGNERMSRAFAALERRMVGKSVDNFDLLSFASTQTASNTHAKRKVASTPVLPRVSANVVANEKAHQEYSNACVRAGGPDEINDDTWEDDSETEEFEVVELPSSSDDEHASVPSDEDDPELPMVDHGDRTTVVASTSQHEMRDDCTSLKPSKKQKLQLCPTCCRSRCTCSSSERMQLLLHRMKEKRSSSSLN